LHQPPDWRPKYRFETYDESDVRDRIEETGLAQPLTCTLSPQWNKVDTNHYCGQWTPRSGTLLQEFTRTNTAYANWRARAESAEEANDKLKLELKNARHRSAKRLEKLRAVTQPSEAAE